MVHRFKTNERWLAVCFAADRAVAVHLPAANLRGVHRWPTYDRWARAQSGVHLSSSINAAEQLGRASVQPLSARSS